MVRYFFLISITLLASCGNTSEPENIIPSTSLRNRTIPKNILFAYSWREGKDNSRIFKITENAIIRNDSSIRYNIKWITDTSYITERYFDIDHASIKGIDTIAFFNMGDHVGVGSIKKELILEESIEDFYFEPFYVFKKL